MKLQILILSAVLLISAAVGRWVNLPPATVLATEVIADPSQLLPECRSTVTVTALQSLGVDGNSERFLVTWNSGLPCLTVAGVDVKVTRRNGTTDTGSVFVESGNQAIVKVQGFRPDNPGVSATATVTVNGIQRGTRVDEATF